MNWHNAKDNPTVLKHRYKRNAERKRAYEANPQFWRNRQAQWRADHPEAHRIIAQRQKEKRWTNPWRPLVILAKARAKQKNIPFDLTYEWAKERWTGFCELTRIPFTRSSETDCTIFRPSLDRIDPKKGYIQDNCRFILFAVNAMKSDGTDEAMYLVAKSLIEHQKAFAPIL